MAGRHGAKKCDEFRTANFTLCVASEELRQAQSERATGRSSSPHIRSMELSLNCLSRLRHSHLLPLWNVIHEYIGNLVSCDVMLTPLMRDVLFCLPTESCRFGESVCHSVVGSQKNTRSQLVLIIFFTQKKPFQLYVQHSEGYSERFGHEPLQRGIYAVARSWKRLRKVLSFSRGLQELTITFYVDGSLSLCSLVSGGFPVSYRMYRVCRNEDFAMEAGKRCSCV